MPGFSKFLHSGVLCYTLFIYLANMVEVMVCVYEFAYLYICTCIFTHASGIYSRVSCHTTAPTRAGGFKWKYSPLSECCNDNPFRLPATTVDTVIPSSSTSVDRPPSRTKTPPLLPPHRAIPKSVSGFLQIGEVSL